MTFITFTFPLPEKSYSNAFKEAHLSMAARLNNSMLKEKRTQRHLAAQVVGHDTSRAGHQRRRLTPILQRRGELHPLKVLLLPLGHI